MIVKVRTTTMMMVIMLMTIKTMMKIVMMKMTKMMTKMMKTMMMINIRVVLAAMAITKNANIGHMVTMAQKINIIGITNMVAGGIKALDGIVKKKSPGFVMIRL